MVHLEPSAEQSLSNLSAESFQFPEKGVGDWYVLHTMSRQEKLVAEMLSAMQIAHFLPLLHQTRYYGKRKFLVELPLFPGYVFLRGSQVEAYESNRTKRIAHILPVHDQLRLDWELRNLFSATENGANLDTYPYLTIGTLVEVRSGPFRGLQGVIDSRLRSNRLILQVGMLGRAVSLEIDAALLDAIVEGDRE
jgi:transcription termination/antitermination protein NusG